jgi:hypothetical protein
MLLAHFLWRATGAGQVATLGEWEAALRETRVHIAGEVEARYDRASRNQQRVMRAIAHGASPFSAATRASLGLEAGSVSKSVELALRDGLIEQHHGPEGEPIAGSYRLVDPLLAEWIRRRFP